MPRGGIIRARAIGLTICVVLICLASSGRGAVLPPDPDNAALLYYQAFLACPEPPERELPRPSRSRRGLEGIYGRLSNQECALNQLEEGAEPDDLVREYVQMCGDAIELTEKAILLPHCDWGTLYSQGFLYRARYVPPMRLLARVLCADARILAADGDGRAALQRGLSVHMLVEHIGSYTNLSFLMGMDVDQRMHLCIRQVLGSASVDVETIRWLKAQIAPLQVAPDASERPLEGGFELLLRTLRNRDKTLSRIRSSMAEAGREEMAKGLTDEELVTRVEESYLAAIDSLEAVMASDLPYEKACSQIQSLLADLEVKVKGDPVAQYLARDVAKMAGDSLTLYSGQISSLARFNALRAALELYLIHAKTGTLPEELPAGLPEDPFSRSPFQYEKTEQGFILRPNVDKVYDHRVEEFVFELKP